MNIQERIQEVIDTLYNGNKRLFANSVGISPTTLENVVGARQGNPSYLLLYKISTNSCFPSPAFDGRISAGGR